MVVDTPFPALWLSPDAQRWALIIEASHSRAFGSPLVARHPVASDAKRSHCQELFACPSPVLAHDGGSDPALIYANAAALRLWRRRWSQMVGMPSRLTAPEQERQERAQALGSAQKMNAFQGYRGIRIDSEGRRFVINNARIWTLWDEKGECCGQAASFSNWWWI